MIFNWTYCSQERMIVKHFLKLKGISRGLLAQVKFHGGKIEVNREETNVLYLLNNGDLLTLTIPDEKGSETIVPSNEKLDIVFEDEHFLVVNKPSGVASLPSNTHTEHTMANRVKGYFMEQDYSSKVVHIVTRLDRNTSGLMIFAKHRYAHALLDKQLREKQIKKKYTAAVTGQLQTPHDFIDAPIGRTSDSIITRKVDENGKTALTEYWIKKRFDKATLTDIQLHTGRTHQIRVHFCSIGHPLVSDTLYGAKQDNWIQRQALHCRELSLNHPLTKEPMIFRAAFPDDLEDWINHQKMSSDIT